MRRRLVRWMIVAALVAAAGALPGDGPHRIELHDVPETLSFFTGADSDRPGETGSDRRS
ncbi:MULTISPECIES: hypothetical protein [Thermomonospora]|uniref:Uncharacterized protein n=1 Tax=Thermomonospora curvata (strain ATCC 19995 / DSM 43183 / JCM 3096 / KCTC 9072 / NBRC 15933 / NCIMB 10081 / Henssen B9) TaxID=471852 RepID=D1A1D9_THECD|nr:MULTISPECIES: hypothetical protein [Thermomonospora]ACY95861.1 hypothetical protein Tcur_0257 [Thermomonospora curvata DSM 43183]